ncbi:putative enoyl-CoA hydratase 1 [Leucobacter aridicollis]|mgnify:CR=1 FL=1|uniref:Acyl dehydratase n=1 Tax=Leucobacter aridicollis TaxID=283878 RepID=A0A852R137_9MICO|nr:MaoC family dehydratase [Leucobacter aridicollis]MBL3681662.1 MaoC family dehydratase [Leucobacter aridicollis]MCS3427875.1 acyl dehydratase [Leucobacter aridicollis]NYD27301.1 acyl dehydratase [Leucobacter aridicollis]
MTISVAHPSALPEAIGQSAVSDWLLVDQARIQAFADATGDHQWIHLDAERAAAGPFGSTIAHGYLTLSLIPHLSGDLLAIDNVAMAVNYGLDRVRFLQPVKSGARVRARVEIASAEESKQGWRVGSKTTIEIEGEETPALVAETIALYVAG